MENFWNYYNRKTVISVTERSDPLETEEKLRLLRLLCDDLMDPDMYGLIVPTELKLRVKDLRNRCWSTHADPLQGDQAASEGVPKVED
jgi:hypothetical protein